MSRIGTLQIGIIVLTIATALIHLGLAYAQLSIGMMGGIMFVLNGLGYLGLLVALYFKLPIELITKNHSLVRWAFIAFTAVTILGWLAIGTRNEIGYADKAIEVVLIVLLFVESRQASNKE